MAKNNNFKIYFSLILMNKYSMNKSSIDGYWVNKEKEERFENKKAIGAIVGVSELIGAASLSGVAQITNVNLSGLIILIGGIGALTTKISVTIKNPYHLKKYQTIDKEYHNEKVKYKKINK